MIAANYHCEVHMYSATASTAQYTIDDRTSGGFAPIVFEPGFQILNEIELDDRIFRLSNPIDVIVSLADGLWINEADLLSISAVGDSKGEALRSFCDDFAVLWDEIASVPDDNLTGDAIRVKQAILGVVESVTNK